MHDVTALLAAIGSHPEEDTPRLVFADWLEEHGQADRAEFVRVQVEAGGLRWDDPRWKELAERAKQLLEAHGEEWVGPLRWLSPGGKFEVHLDEPKPDGWGGGVQLSWIDPAPGDFGDPHPPYERAIEFHRGFPRRVWLEPDVLLTMPDAELMPGPQPRLVIKWDLRTYERDWVGELWPGVSRALRSGRFADWMFTTFNYEFQWFGYLAADPDVARGVSGLLLESGGGGPGTPTDADIANLYPLMPILDDLTFSYGHWSPAVIRELGRSGLLRRLRTLEYHDVTFDHTAADALRAMAEVGEWPGLLGLTLHDLRGVAGEVPDLIRPGMFPALRKLAFWGDGGTAELFTALLDSPHLRHVERIEYWQLGLRQNRSAALERLQDRFGGRFFYK